MSSNGRTTASDAVCLGSSPSVPKSNKEVCRGDGMVDMLGLEPSAQRCAGSSPVPGNYIKIKKVTKSVEKANRIPISSIVALNYYFIPTFRGSSVGRASGC